MRYRGKYEAVSQTRSSRKRMNIHLQMLVTSAVSFVLCCSMLLGTTMAWFTDTITSSANQILIGELKVDVECDGTSLRDSNTPVFGGENDKTIWSPGVFRVRELEVINAGNLDLDYTLTFLSEQEDQSAFQYFTVYVKEGAMAEDHNVYTLQSIQDGQGWYFQGTLADILNGTTPYVFNGTLKAAADGEKPTSDVYTIALCMDTNVSDPTIQGANLTLNIQLKATQINSTEEQTQSSGETETETETETE